MASTTYLSFQQTTVNDKIRAQFLLEASGMDLAKIIKDNKSLKTVFHSAIGVDNVYLVCIVGQNDHALVKLGREYGFPRGFPVIWIPKTMMQYFGFYPKFDNDDRQAAEKLTEFDKVVSLRFFKKWSGFLAQVISFTIANQQYWTVLSKNSANNTSPFVCDAKRLFEPLITESVLAVMKQNQLHFCAETMSKSDQTHGSAVAVESPVITAIGKGKLYDLTCKPAADVPGFVDFYDHESIVKFCNTHKLPCDSSVTINNPDSCRQFLQCLSAQRDFMTNSKFENLLTQFTSQNMIVNAGTINHDSILGETLEGLVVALTKEDGTTETKKIKFANYTIRTMLLREKFINFTLDASLKEAAHGYVQHWCVSDEGKKYWRQFALHCFLRYNNFVSTDPQIGAHIQIANQVNEEMANGKLEANIEAVFDSTIKSSVNGTVIICIGPIGSGKTTMAGILANDTKFVHIDGDTLDVGAETTSRLSNERNDYTRWKIIQALMQGKIPVISTGGGVLFSMGKVRKTVIRSQITSTLGINCKIITCIAGKFDSITKLTKDYNPTEIYNDTTNVTNSVTKRVKNGVWQMDPKFKSVEDFAKFISNKSTQNCDFAKQLITGADLVFGFPMITVENYGIQSSFGIADIVANVAPCQPIASGKFGQIRLLIDVQPTGAAPHVGHITWSFNPKNDTIYKLSDFDNLAAKYPATVGGKFIKCNSETGSKSYTFAVPDYPIHSDGSTHITVNSGCHAPKETGVIVKAINAGNPNVELPSTDKKIVKYDFAKNEIKPCTLRILAAFGI